MDIDRLPILGQASLSKCTDLSLLCRSPACNVLSSADVLDVLLPATTIAMIIEKIIFTISVTPLNKTVQKSAWLDDLLSLFIKYTPFFYIYRTSFTPLTKPPTRIIMEKRLKNNKSKNPDLLVSSDFRFSPIILMVVVDASMDNAPATIYVNHPIN
ncbi:hypothetical protein [Enterobacter cloacae]|uniref:hypothetical protein n=1 Tax=Enterobacter cloacae TaxID=550 RepID=UPI000B8D495E|nr:hypothetical protein [Enterobacter cloacae]ASQ19567.1 hypothetical protein BJM06_03813 [Enterobacter cloacae]MBN4791944.1 hypothetical protein [Enterobacter cloacae]